MGIRKLCIALAAVGVAWLWGGGNAGAFAADGGATLREKMQEKREARAKEMMEKREEFQEKRKEIIANIQRMRRLIREAHEAKLDGDRDAAKAKIKEVSEIWASFSDNVRAKIDENCPGTGEKIKKFSYESIAVPAPDDDDGVKDVTNTASGKTAETSDARHGDKTVGPDGRTITSEGTAVRDGNTVTRESTTTFPDGTTRTYDGTAVRDGNTVTRDGALTTRKGETVEHDGTSVKDGNTITREDTWTNSTTGKTVTTEGTTIREGDTVTRESTTTLPGGKTIERDSTVVKDGNTKTLEGTTTLPDGKVITREGTAVKDGNVTTYEGTTTMPSGKTRESEGTITREGNTMTHEGTTTLPSGGVITREGTATREGNTTEWERSKTYVPPVGDGKDVVHEGKDGGVRKVTDTGDKKHPDKAVGPDAKDGAGKWKGREKPKFEREFGNDFDVFGKGGWKKAEKPQGDRPKAKPAGKNR